MTYNPQSAPQDYTDDEFYSFIDCLKRQEALPQDSFIRDVPFFNLSLISKESQIKELFQNSCDPNSYKALLKNIISLPKETEKDQSDSTSSSNMMTFAQLCLYKVLPCPDPLCPNRPREIVTHNQYKDHEYECPFYHHERDRRRMVISIRVDEEFEYKANYFEEGRSNAEREKYSLNYFESMFHPLYYKMFRCKREYCKSCQFCPFFHHEQEKKTWDKTFGSFIKKDRITYVKDKQKYYESTSNQYEQKSSGNSSPNKPYGPNDRQHPQKRNNRQQRSPKIPNQNQNPNISSPNEVKTGNSKLNVNNRGEWTRRKGSDESFGVNTAPFAMFNGVQHTVTYRAC